MPLSTLQTTPRGVASKTRGQDGFATSFPVGLFHPLQHAGLSRRSPDCRHPCSHLSSEGRGVSGALGRACKSTVSGCSTRTVCLSASVPALGRTRHPFAVSDSEESSQKIEFVFSASPETIRREPREGDLLRSVGNMQDLAVCAFCSSCLFRQYLCCRGPAFFSRHEVSLLPIHGKQIRYHLPGYGKCRPIPISFLPFVVINHSQFVTLSRCQLRSFYQSTLDMLVALFRERHTHRFVRRTPFVSAESAIANRILDRSEA